MRKPNGYGAVIKLPGNRRKPYAARVTTGWTDEGKQNFRYIGYYPSRKDAEIALAEYNKFSCGYENDVTLEQLWSIWHKNHDISDRTMKEYERAWKTLLPFYSQSISKIDRKSLQNHIDSNDYSKGTARLVKIILTQMYAYGSRQDLISPDRANIPTLLEYDSIKERKTIIRANFKATDVCRMWKDVDTYRPYLILLYTGLRIGEFLALNKETIHLKEQYFDIVKAKTKAGIRQVPIADAILPLVSENMYYTYDQLKKFLKKDMGHSLHDTRHTFISMMTEIGTDARIIKQIVGHAGRDITEDVYTHVSLERKLEAVNKLPVGDNILTIYKNIL